MRKIAIIVGVVAAWLGLALHVEPAAAQSTRTWVSGVGDDVNPCSRTAPCKTFAGAISKTAAGGEISVLDSGGFGAVTITKSISIIAEGSQGSIVASGTTGIIVSAGANDVVSLHGLFIEGSGTGITGIRFRGGGQLHIRHCLIRGFRTGAGIGLHVETTGNSRVFVSDTTFTNNTAGVLVKFPGGTAVFLNRVEVERNATFGIRSDGGSAVVRVNDFVVINNATGLEGLNGGQIISYGNNTVAGNTINGTPTTTVPQI